MKFLKPTTQTSSSRYYCCPLSSVSSSKKRCRHSCVAHALTLGLRLCGAVHPRGAEMRRLTAETRLVRSLSPLPHSAFSCMHWSRNTKLGHEVSLVYRTGLSEITRGQRERY